MTCSKTARPTVALFLVTFLVCASLITGTTRVGRSLDNEEGHHMEHDIRHLGIIMDGNGRWAERRSKPRTLGHKKGAENIRAIIEHARKRGITFLTLYAFSTENWKRKDNEVNAIMKLLRYFAKREIESMVSAGISVRFIGRRDRLPQALVNAMCSMERATEACTDMTLAVAVNYGGRDEIVRAAEAVALSGEPFTEMTLAEHLDTKHMPDVDLVIRTGGNQRVSNFLLWQIAYAEIHFTETLWPDFTPEEFDLCINLFLGTERRFGGVPAAAE